MAKFSTNLAAKSSGILSLPITISADYEKVNY